MTYIENLCAETRVIWEVGYLLQKLKSTFFEIFWMKSWCQQSTLIFLHYFFFFSFTSFLWTYLFEYLLVVKLVYIVLFALHLQFFFSLVEFLLFLVHLILNEISNAQCNFFPGGFSNIPQENILCISDTGSMTIWPGKTLKQT